MTNKNFYEFIDGKMLAMGELGNVELVGIVSELFPGCVPAKYAYVVYFYNSDPKWIVIGHENQEKLHADRQRFMEKVNELAKSPKEEPAASVEEETK